MALDHIQDRIRWGLNVAARNIGATTDAYRPASTSAPIVAVQPVPSVPCGLLRAGQPLSPAEWLRGSNLARRIRRGVHTRRRLFGSGAGYLVHRGAAGSPACAVRQGGAGRLVFPLRRPLQCRCQYLQRRYDRNEHPLADRLAREHPRGRRVRDTKGRSALRSVSSVLDYPYASIWRHRCAFPAI